MEGKRRTLALGIGIILFLTSLSVATILNATPINRQLHSWKLLPEPEPLTELYFTDHSTLPLFYWVGHPQTVSFATHNLEYRTVTYHYQILQSSDDGSSKAELASGNFTLQHNQSTKTQALVVLGDLGTHSRVNVVLSTGESIYYRVKKGGV